MSSSSSLLMEPLMAHHHLWGRDSSPSTWHIKLSAIGPGSPLASVSTASSLHLSAPASPLLSPFPQPALSLSQEQVSNSELLVCLEHISYRAFAKSVPLSSQKTQPKLTVSSLSVNIFNKRNMNMSLFYRCQLFKLKLSQPSIFYTPHTKQIFVIRY